ncbi:hypothetical protein T05_12422 [Trichinella murrelli]|uniref:Uncharacterized protein n=1 Tax=Trichinella murrelli TaxID=144512 RepID=A0A0V0T504_9BILA|nr:hypothetical protein T05_201 [Trichinella murrelli]KRX34164.1 hypothetical protein T05_12422 [Trichinella murrelli]
MIEERLYGLAAICAFILNVHCGSTAQDFTRQDILFCGILNIRKPWKGIAFVASTGKLNVLIRLTFLLG